MKRRFNSSLLFSLLSFVLLGFMLHSCDVPNQASQSKRLQPTEAETQRRLRADYGQVLDLAAGQLAQVIQKKIAPSSGKELTHTINLYPISYNEDETLIGCPIEISFLARDFWGGVGYGTCKVWGALWLQVPQYKGRPYRVIFQLKDYNDQLNKVSNESQRNWLNDKVTFDLNLR